MAIIGFSLFVIGIIFIIVAPINKRKNHRCSAQTQGILVKKEPRFDSDGPLSDMNVYSYRVDGVEYRLKATAINEQASNVGDQCTIWYNPTKPKEAQEFRYNSGKVYTIILIIGIALIIMGIALTGVGFVLS